MSTHAIGEMLLKKFRPKTKNSSERKTLNFVFNTNKKNGKRWCLTSVMKSLRSM